MRDHIVKQGECLLSTANRYGLHWEQIWQHDDNNELRSQRKNPSILAPGDVVRVKELEAREHSGETEQRHRFLKKGAPTKLHLRILREEQPMADVPFVLRVDGKAVEGVTDSEGCIEETVPCQATKGVLSLKDLGEINLEIGSLDPASEISGVQGRLINLGYDCGAVDGLARAQTRSCLETFQEFHDLEISGEPDEATRQKLEELHGS